MFHSLSLFTDSSPVQSVPQGVLQRCACGSLADSSSECAACRQKRQAREGQSQLKVGSSGDSAEQEAEAIATRVMGGGAVALHALPTSASTLHRQAHANIAPPQVQSHLPPGQALDPSTRRFMESCFGHDFSGVRVHTGAEAEARAEAVQARAYTVGQQITFGAGEYAPSASEGRRLLAHELTHVVQQRATGPTLHRDRRDPQDVRAARASASRLAQRIRIHTRLSKEVRASINRDLSFFEGAAKDAYLQIIRPALQSVNEIQMPALDARRSLSPVRPVTSLFSLTADQMCGGQCLTDDEVYAGLNVIRDREKAEQEAQRERELNKLRAKTKDWDQYGGDDQEFALELLRQILTRNLNPDLRGVSDHIQAPILARLERWLQAVDGQRMAACAADKPGLIATVRGRANNDDPCKSWFADAYSHGPSELHDLEAVLRLHRGAGMDAADQVYWDMFEYRRKTDPGMLQQEQMASALVGLGVAVAGGINAKVNSPKVTPAKLSPPEPTPQPNLRVVQGGGQTTPARGQLFDVDQGPPVKPASVPGQASAANDNAVQPPLRATGTDPVKPITPPQATRRIVSPTSPGTKIVTNKGVTQPAPIQDPVDDTDTGSPSRPYRGRGSKQMSKNYAHDVGVSEGTKAAQRDGLEHVYDNPFGISPTTPGQDSVFRNRASQRPVVVEFKGGDARLAPGQMENAEINRQIRDLEQRLPNHPVTQMLRNELDNGTLTGRTYSTPIGPNGETLPTTVQTHGPYTRIP